MSGTPESVQKDVARVLSALRFTETGESALNSVRVEACAVADGQLRVILEAVRAVSPADSAAVRSALSEAFPAYHLSVVMTRHRAAPAAGAAPSSGHQGGGHQPLKLPGASPAPEGAPLPGVKAVIAVASGKGGVGKSTTAVNLAVGLGMRGLSVGLMDADVHGPSLPCMLGTEGRPDVRDGKLVPVPAWGIQAMSVGMMVDASQAVVWRGPMVAGAIGQLLSDVAWGSLDVLVIDMPPGTGDAQLTLVRKAVLTGAVIVSTPQDIALLDARRAVTMFEKTNVPVLGLVENMSYFCCPNCDHRTELFGHGGARAEAERLKVPFLGEIPLLADIRLSADEGAPVVIRQPDSEAGAAYRRLAGEVAELLEKRGLV